MASQKPATVTTVTNCGSLDRLKKHLNYVSHLNRVESITLDESPVNRGIKATVTLRHAYEKYHSDAEEALEINLNREILDPANIAIDETIVTLHFPVAVTHVIRTTGSHVDPIKLTIV